MKKHIFFIAYGVFLILVTVFSYAFVDPNLSYLQRVYSGFYLQHRLLTTSIFTFLVIASCIFYGLIIYLFHKKILMKREIIKLLVVTAIILSFAYPAMLSYDMFNYLATARVTYHYQENPYIIMPIEFPNDPTFAFTRATNKVALYGPVWIILSVIPFVTGLGQFLLTLFSMKIFIALWYGLTLLMLYKISKRLLPVVLFGFHPLLLFETLVSGHNDIVMVALALIGFYFLNNRRFITALLFLLASILIKYATIVLLPVFLFVMWQEYRKNKVQWSKVYLFSGVLLFGVFLLSPIREELYPWYAVWFLSYIVLTPKKSYLIFVTVIFSAGLLFRYIPYMLSGNYFGTTPLLRILLTIIPFLVFCACGYIFRKKIIKYIDP